MPIAVIISVIFFTIGINTAVVLHHDYTDKEISKRHNHKIMEIDKRKMVEMELKTPKKDEPYSFHYAGKEQYSNVFSTYRFNKETGEILRYSHHNYEKDKEGTPAHEQVSIINMLTGDQANNIGSMDLVGIRIFWREQREKKKEEEAKN